MTHQPSRPASIVEISEALQVLFDTLPFQRGAKSDNAAAAYVTSLQGCTVEAINAGIKKFLRGECEDVSPRFIPTPPELAKIVRTAVVQQRIPATRRIAPHHTPLPGERARMKLKMPMWQAAFGNNERMDALAKANADGFAAMVVLATTWRVPIPDELLEIPDEEAERQWRYARSNALASIEANPPPYLIKQRLREARS